MRLALLLLLALGCEDDNAAGEAAPDANERAEDAGTVDGALPPGAVCAEGQTRCIEGRIASCLEGTAWLAEDCPEREICADGACVEFTCQNGERRCFEGGVQACVDGAWGGSEDCDAEQSCRDGVCLARSCEPGETACGQAVVLTCDEAGLGWSREPCEGRCLDGECVEAGGDCPPGQVLCGPEGRFECQEGGFVLEPCADGEACFEGACVACVRDADCAEGVCEDGSCVPAPLQVLTDRLPAAQVDQPYLIELEAAGGRPAYTWSLAEGAALPEGLALLENGSLDGAPTEAGEFPFEVVVRDSVEGEASAELRLVVHAEGLVISTESPLPAAEEGEAYALDFEALGGEEPYGWLIVEGALPAGLNLGAAGEVRGTPNEIGRFEFTLRVVDAANPPNFAEKPFVLEVEVAPLRIVGEQTFDLFITQIVVLPVITVVQDIPIPYDTRLQARGGLRPHTWVETPIPDGLRRFIPQSGLPEGLTLEEDGRLHGAVVDTAQVIAVPIPFTMINLTGFFFFAEVRDSQEVPDADSAIFLLPTLPIGG